MAKRHFPVFPNLEQLRHQAKDLLRAIRRGEAAALQDLATHHPERVEPDAAKLADAQLALARSYGVPSWPRLVIACRMTRRDLARRHRHRARARAEASAAAERARERREGMQLGPPMSFAANLGRERIIAMLRGMGAEDVQSRWPRGACRDRSTPRGNCTRWARGRARRRDGTAARRRTPTGSRCCSSSARSRPTTRRPDRAGVDAAGHVLPEPLTGSIDAWSCAPRAASRCRIRRRWPCIAAGSICWKRC